MLLECSSTVEWGTTQRTKYGLQYVEKRLNKRNTRTHQDGLERRGANS